MAARAELVSRICIVAKDKMAGVRNTLVVAAEEMARRGAVSGEVANILADHVLPHFGDAIRQYMSLRLRDEAQASRAFSEFVSWVRSADPQALAAPPGIQARLYKKARALTVASGVGPTRSSVSSLRFRTPRDASREYVSALNRLRMDLPSRHAELLELLYVRALSNAEIAFILGIEEEAAHAQMEEAFDSAREKVVDFPVPRAVQDAFMIEKGALAVADVDSETGEDNSLMLSEGTLINGRYQIDKHIGSGGFADVYRATDTDVPGHRVAIKLLHHRADNERERRAAIRELHLIASVFHPSIVQFKDHGWFDSRLWFVMPWYEGQSLEARLKEGALSRAEARRIFVPLARALSSMHAAGIRHQDVKPDNVFLAKVAGYGDDEEGILPVLLDLGVAAKEAELVVAGTPDYLAPEVAAQFAQMPRDAIGPPADIFSLALTLRDALQPELREDVADGSISLFIARRADEVPAAPDTKDLKYLKSHFSRWMHLDPSERPSADELADELDVLTLPEERRARRMRLIRTVGPIAFAALVAFAAVVWTLKRNAEQQAARADVAVSEAEAARALHSEEQARSAELANEVENASAKLASTNLSKQELTKKLGRTRGELNFAKKSLARRRKELSSLQEAHDTLSRKAQDLSTRLTSTENNLRTSQTKYSEANAALTKARADVSRLSGEVNNAQAELASLRTSEQTARSEINKLNERIRSLDALITQLRSELRAARAQRPSTGGGGEAGGGITTGDGVQEVP